jgi:hypothetical protein
MNIIPDKTTGWSQQARLMRLTLPLLGSMTAAGLIVVGWLGSDARALQQLRRREHLSSPEAVFA